jgi:hypothetical protein
MGQQGGIVQQSDGAGHADGAAGEAGDVLVEEAQPLPQLHERSAVMGEKLFLIGRLRKVRGQRQIVKARQLNAAAEALHLDAVGRVGRKADAESAAGVGGIQGRRQPLLQQAAAPAHALHFAKADDAQRSTRQQGAGDQAVPAYIADQADAKTEALSHAPAHGLLDRRRQFIGGQLSAGDNEFEPLDEALAGRRPVRRRHFGRRTAQFQVSVGIDQRRQQQRPVQIINRGVRELSAQFGRRSHRSHPSLFDGHRSVAHKRAVHRGNPVGGDEHGRHRRVSILPARFSRAVVHPGSTPL